MIIIEVLVAYKSFLRSINLYTSKSDEADMTFIKECFVHIQRSFSIYVCVLHPQHFIHERNNLNITAVKKVFWLKQYVPLGSFNALMHKYMEPISWIFTTLFVEDKRYDRHTSIWHKVLFYNLILREKSLTNIFIYSIYYECKDI